MDPRRDLMLEPESPTSIAMATDHAIPVVSAGGITALTPKAVADRVGCSRQAVHQWFGDRPLRQMVAVRFTSRWCRWTAARVSCEGVAGLLPEDEEVAGWTRVWLALVELAGRDPDVAELVEEARRWELSLIRSALRGPVPSEAEVLALHCLVEGLRLRLCRPPPTMSFDLARRLLEDAAGCSAVPARHLA